MTPDATLSLDTLNHESSDVKIWELKFWLQHQFSCTSVRCAIQWMVRIVKVYKLLICHLKVAAKECYKLCYL